MKEKTIIKLPELFGRNGFSFKCVYRDANFYIYRVTDKKGNVYFELFRRKLMNVGKDFKNVGSIKNTFKEKYPKDEDFGKWAWRVPTKRDALLKIIDLK